MELNATLILFWVFAGLVGVYVAARLASAAYFKSKEEAAHNWMKGFATHEDQDKE